MNKKIVSKTKFLINIIISALIWSFLLSFIYDIVIGLFNRVESNVLIIILSYFVWMIMTLLIVFMSYISNIKRRVAKYEMEKVKIIGLVIFYIMIIGINLTNIVDGVITSPIIWIPLIIIDMFLIALINELSFRRFIANEKK